MDGATLTDPSNELAEWTRAVVDVDVERVQQLCQSYPDLLWTALDKDSIQINTEYAHLHDQLERLQVLGPELGDLAAIPYMLLDHLETDDETTLPLSVAQQKRARLLTYLVKQANKQELNTQSWGTCNNTLLHLAFFLGHRQISSQLVQQGALLTATNDLGYAPKDILQAQKKMECSKTPVTKPLQSQSSSERFKQLRAMATEQTVDGAKQQSSQDDSRLQNKRQQDLSLLAQRSAVKNNPLFKKFEQPVTSPTKQETRQKRAGKLSVPDDGSSPRRTSKVISSLKGKSYVSSSVFRQGEMPSRSSSPLPPSASSSRATSPMPPISPSFPNIKDTSSNALTSTVESESELPSEPVDNVPQLPTPPQTEDPVEQVARPQTFEQPADHDSSRLAKDQTEVDGTNAQRELPELPVQPASDSGRRWSGNRRSHWSAAAKPCNDVLGPEGLELRKSMHSEPDSEQEFFDSCEEWTEEGGVRVSLKPRPQEGNAGDKSPLRKSMLAIKVMRDDDDDEVLQADDTGDDDTAGPSSFQREDDAGDKQTFSAKPTDAHSVDETSVESHEPAASFSPKQRVSMGAESVDTWPPPSSSPPRLSRYSTDNFDLKGDDQYELGTLMVHDATQPEHSVVEEHPSVQQEYTHRQQVEATRLQEEHAQHKWVSAQPIEAYGSVAVASTSRYVAHRLPQDQPAPSDYNQFVTARPQSVKLELPAVNTSPGQSTSAFGKLYVRVSNADDLLLPIPKLPTFVRCVVSDGQYEYMSRYETLEQKVSFDYECVVDARPDMIITVSLHARPDVHVRPKTGFSRWLTPAHKQRQMLSGYVHPEDGSVGQSRFALGHMIQACNQKTYGASFDCFNSWFARSSKERQRQLRGEEDMLKVVGSFTVEMLYLPVSDPSLPIPKSLRECDLSLRIRQWHQTCWHSGYLSMRKDNSQIWERQYCRLIGSQLIAYASMESASSFDPLGKYDIADALRLVAASDQVIVTLVDLPDTRVFKQNSIVEQTGRGFFRISFPDTYLDCVCDESQESEEWVRVLKSMIGRVPLKMHFST